MAYRDIAARLGMKHDVIRRKVSDNNLELTGTPTDCIRIKVKKSQEGDPISSTVEKADVVNITFPPMVDVPYRYIRKQDSEGGRAAFAITSLVAATMDDQQKAYEITAPHGAILDIDDLICRVFLDPEQELPIVLVMKVTEMLGTIGSSMMFLHKYRCTIEMSAMPEAVVSVIAEMAQRRLKVKF